MAKQKFEKTQKGNPHQLPVRQHVFPKGSISRFTDRNGLVWLQHISPDRVRGAKPTDDTFCAMRAWDTRAERGYMKQIEDAFQELASKVINHTVVKIGTNEKEKIDAFFALWKMRAIFKTANRTEVHGVTGQRLTHDQEEVYEKAGVFFIREGGKMSAHRVYGAQMQVGIDQEASALSNVQWGFIRAHEGQFVVPDFPVITLIPLEPALCLCFGGKNRIIPRQTVADINRHLRAGSREYFFAQDLRRCP